jgi:MFS family permease
MNKGRLFLGCFLSLVATAFGFAVRAAVVGDWREQFNLSNEQLASIGGAGLFPFAISIILFSLIVDKIGYGRSMVFAFVGHMTSTLLSIFATNFTVLYLATFLFALSNGIVEAVINPVVATVYDKNKTHWLNILHAGWPGGLVVGGILAILIGFVTNTLGLDPKNMPFGTHLWQWQMGILLIPTILYGLLLMGQEFPVQERVAAGVSYMDMLKEFGTASAWIVSFLLVAGLDQVLRVVQAPLAEWPGIQSLHSTLSNSMPAGLVNLILYAVIGLIPTALFGVFVRSIGRPMFVFMLFIMFLLATTELGTDGWISDIMRSVLQSPTKGSLFLVYTSLIMFILRFFAGPIVHRISPLGLLAVSAVLACAGLVFLSQAGSSAFWLFLAATIYGFGKTFFWPTTLGVVSEQYPKGGALMLNAIAGVGMLAVGTLGNSAIGIVQDRNIDTILKAEAPAIHQKVMEESPGLAGKSMAINQNMRDQLPPAEKDVLANVQARAQQSALAVVAILPALMAMGYLILIGYFKTRGGYKTQSISGGH